MSWNVNGITLQGKENTARFYDEVIGAQCYKVNFNDLNVIDLGANVGLFSSYIYPQARQIWAIEAHGPTYEVLKGNLQGLEKVQTFHCAIAGANGLRYINNDRIDDGGYTIMGVGPEKGLPVKAWTLNEFMNQYNITWVDLLKMDVESAEQEIVMAPDFPQAAAKIGRIVAEMHGGSECAKNRLVELGFEDIYRESLQHYFRRK